MSASTEDPGNDINDDEESSQVVVAPRRRKCKNRLAQLAERFPDVTYQVIAIYGPESDPIYVIEVNNIGGKVIFLCFKYYTRRVCDNIV